MFKRWSNKITRPLISTVLAASLLLSVFPLGLIDSPFLRTSRAVSAAPDDDTYTLEKALTGSDGKNYRFTATYTSDSGIPADAELIVKEIIEDEKIDAYLEDTQTALESDKIGYARFFDICIAKDGEELQPEDGSKVNMQILLEDAGEDDLSVVHFPEDPGNGSVEVVENTTSSENTDTVVEFDTEGFSVYGIVSTTVFTTITASDGRTYRIEASFTDKSGIPSDAELKVSEISEEEYADYLTSASQAIGEDIHSVVYGKFFDISLEKAGVKYQPVDGSTVKVKVDLMDTPKVEDVKVVHFEGDTAEELTASTNGRSVRFETDGFSVFSFLDFSLTDRMVNATIDNDASDSEMKTGTLFSNDDIVISGSMPSTGIIEAKRVDVSVNGKDAIVAYDIKIYASELMKILGITWQPGASALSVQLKSDAIKAPSVDVYHMEDTNSPAQLVSENLGAKNRTVTFDAASFSVYVIIEHEGEAVETPRVAFHYISPNYQENNNEGIYSYTAPGYEFLNKHNEYQITQILKDGETLEQIVNPPNKTDSLGQEVSFFYGWYTVDASEDTTEYNTGAPASPYYNGTITYTWMDPKKVPEKTAISITPVDENSNGTIEAGESVNWSIGATSGTAVIDSEGTAHVYIAPVYEDYHFVNFHMGHKEANAGLRNNLLTRRLVVFGQNSSAVVRIGDVEAPSPDPRHQIFAGWETVDFTDPSTPQTVIYYETLDIDGNEKNILQDGTTTTPQADGYGFKIKLTKSDSTPSSLDLYPVFAEARWVNFNTGRSGNGASYVGSLYRLTNDENKGTAFTSFSTSTRPGYLFAGWYLSPTDGTVNTADQLTDETGAFVASAKGKTYYGSDTTISTDPTAGEKLFEITSDGRLLVYKALDSLTVYANWVPDTVDYTVVYWLQNANDDDYTLMYYKRMTDIAGHQTAAAPIATSESIYTENNLKFMHLSTDQDKATAGDQNNIQQKEIAGDGSTIVNVYYDRDVYTLRFDIGFAAKTSNSGSTTTYTTMTASEAETYSGTVYGVVNGNYVPLTRYTLSDGTEIFGYVDNSANSGTMYGADGGVYSPVTANTTNTTTYTADYKYTQNNNATTNLFGLVNGEYVPVYRIQRLYSPDYFTNASKTDYYWTGNGFSNAVTIYNVNGTYYRTRSGRIGNYTYSNEVIPYSRGTDQTYYYYLDGGDRYTGTSRYTRATDGSTDVTNNSSLNTTGRYYIDDNGGKVPVTAHSSTVTTYTMNGNTYTGDIVVPYSGKYYQMTTMSGTWRYFVSGTTAPNYSATSNWDTFLTADARDLGTTNPFGPDEYTGTYEVSGIRYNNNSYDGVIYYYDITAKYGENILNRYPGSQPPRVNGNNSYLFVGWLAQRDSYYNARLNTSIKGYFETVSEDLILTGGAIPGYNTKNENVSPNNYSAVTVDKDNNTNSITGEYGITQEFHCRYTSLNGAKKYLYRIYLSDVDNINVYPDEPTEKFVITAGSGSNPDIQTPPTYYGYHMVSKVLIDSNGNELVPRNDNYSEYEIPELNQAGVGNGMIMVFRFQPNEHKLAFKYGFGADSSLINTEFAAPQNINYGQSLANSDTYTDAAIAATPAGYSFKGWYENFDGVGNPFNFNSTMPDGDIVLYAVYEPVRYRVIINPNGAEIDHIDHTGDSYTGSYNGIPYSFEPFNRAANGERSADSGYNKSQSTYINGTFGKLIEEYTLRRNHVPIGDAAATSYNGRLYYYVNFQYNSSDGSGLPSDLRNALYVDVTPSTPGGEIDETELRALYDFFHEDTATNFDLAPELFPGMTAQNLSYDAWKNLYVQKQSNGSNPQLFRKCNEKENWVFLGWFKDGESMPYNFSTPVSGPFTLTARWRLDGGYTIQYTPEYWLDSEDGNRYLINGAMDSWTDPDPNAATGVFSYTDGAPTTIYKQPTDLTKNGIAVNDESVNFLGWRVVSITSTTVNGQTIQTYTPLEDGVLYDPGDDYIVNVQFADSNNIIHMQAVYEETGSSLRRPNIANLTLDANGGYMTDGAGNDISEDRNVIWSGVGTILLDASEEQLIFGDIQANAAIHLYKYSTSDVDTGLSGGKQYFKHPEGYLLIGFDPQSDPESIVWVDPQNDAITGGSQPYVPNYPADSIIAVQRTDDKKLYAIWEPMVYATFENKTAGEVTFTLSSTDGALEVINVKKGMYDRTPLSSADSITLAPGEKISLAFPKGAEKTITVSGTNNLGPGKVLMWDTSIELQNDRTYSTNPAVDPDPDNNSADPDTEFNHTVNNSTHTHELASGEKNNLQNFTFDEKLLVNDKPLTVTFTSRDNAYALLLKDNWNGDGTGGGTQEIDYTLDDIQPDPVTGEPKSQVLPGTSTRFGYSFVGWAYEPDATQPDFRASGNMLIPNLSKDDGFFSEGTQDIDGVTTRTLYAVWEPLKDAVYIYKEVPEPGNQKKPFDFTLAITGSYHVGSTNYVINSSTNQNSDTATSKVFSIKHGEYLRVVTTVDYGIQAGHTKAFIQAEVEVYYPVIENGTTRYEKDMSRSAIVRWERTVTPRDNNGFTGLMISATEATDQYYTTSVTLDYEEHDDQLMLGSETYDVSDIPQTKETNQVSWTNTDAHGTVIYNNVIKTYDVAVEKTLIRNTSDPENFQYTASYVLDKGTYPSEVQLFAEPNSFIVTSGTTNDVALKGIPAGAELTIKEQDDDNYDTTILRGSTETEGKETVFTVTENSTVKYTNTLKSYPVKFIKIDQAGNAGVVAATFNLVNSTGKYNLGTNLQAYDNAGSNGVFYTSDDTYEPLYAGYTYTLTETFTESGYLGLDGPVTIKVSGDKNAPFTISDPRVTAEWDNTNKVWIFEVKNLEEKDISIVKALHDPLLTQRTFKFRWSYKFDSNLDNSIDPDTEIFSGTFTLSPISGSTAGTKLTIPAGATDLVIEELYEDSGSDKYAWVKNVYDTKLQLNSETATEGYSYTIRYVDTAATITFTNTRKTVPVTVRKKVVGEGGTFNFEALLSYSSAISNYTLNDRGTTDTTADDLITGTDGKAPFTLSPARNGEDTIILSVPYGANLNVTETSTGAFTTSVQTGTDPAQAGITTGQLTITDPVTITFTNSDVTIAPTGYSVTNTPYMWIFILGILIIAGMNVPFFFWKNKRRKEEQE